MPGWSSWIQDSYDYVRVTAYHYGKSVLDTGYQIRDFTRYFFGSSSVRTSAVTTISEAYQGYAPLLNSAAVIPPLATSQKVRRAQGRVLATATVYVGTFLLYEFAMAQIKKLYPDLEGSWTESAIDMEAKMLLVRSLVGLWFTRKSQNDNTYKAVYDKYYAPLPGQKDLQPHPEIQECEDGSAAGIQAGLASGIYAFVNRGVIHFVSSAVPYGKIWLEPPLLVIYHGNAFIETKLSTVWMCTKHRQEKITRNLPYAIGQGTSLYSQAKLISGAIKIGYCLFAVATGALPKMESIWDYFYAATFGVPGMSSVGNYVIDDAAFDLAYNYHIILALSNNKELPGKRENGLDIILYYQRMVTESIRKFGDVIFPRIKNSQNRGDVSNALAKIAEFPPVKLAKYIFVEPNLSSLKQFEKHPAWLEYIDFYYDNLIETLKTILTMRKQVGTNLVRKYDEYIPLFLVSQDKRDILKLMMDEMIPDEQIHQLIDYFKRLKNTPSVMQHRIEPAIDQPRKSNIELLPYQAPPKQGLDDPLSQAVRQQDEEEKKKLLALKKALPKSNIDTIGLFGGGAKDTEKNNSRSNTGLLGYGSSSFKNK